MSRLREPPQLVRDTALRLRDECAAAAQALDLVTVEHVALESRPRAILGARRELIMGEWRLAAGTDVRKTDATYLLVCWAVADGGPALGRHSFDARMFQLSGSAGPREMSKDEMAAKVKD